MIKPYGVIMHKDACDLRWAFDRQYNHIPSHRVDWSAASMDRVVEISQTFIVIKPLPETVDKDDSHYVTLWFEYGDAD